MLNRVILMGRLTHAPELKYTVSNVPVCTISLAVERSYAGADGKREADFIDVVCWRHTAEFVSRYFRKGLLVAVEGRLSMRRWTDKQGNNRVAHEVIADSVYFAERAQQGAQPQSGFDQITGAAVQAGVPAQRGSWPVHNEPDDEFAPYDDDDVPF